MISVTEFLTVIVISVVALVVLIFAIPIVIDIATAEICEYRESKSIMDANLELYNILDNNDTFKSCMSKCSEIVFYTVYTNYCDTKLGESRCFNLCKHQV